MYIYIYVCISIPTLVTQLKLLNRNPESCDGFRSTMPGRGNVQMHQALMFQRSDKTKGTCYGLVSVIMSFPNPAGDPKVRALSSLHPPGMGSETWAPPRSFSTSQPTSLQREPQRSPKQESPAEHSSINVLFGTFSKDPSHFWGVPV